MHPIIMHCNYCEQGQSLLEMCQKAVDWGFDGVEFRRKRFNTEEGVEEYLDALSTAVEKAGLKNTIFGYPTIDAMTDDAAKRGNELQSAIDFYRMANERFKLSICNCFSGVLLNPDKSIPYRSYEFHGSAIATDDHYTWAVEGFKVLGKLAEELDFRFAFELHNCYLHDLPSSTRKLLDMIGSPRVGANLDYGNIIYMDGAPSLAESIKILGKDLFYVHLKNSIPLETGGRLATSIADGEINHREYLRLLKEVGFNGPICIEAPRSGDREWFAKQDLAYIKSVLSDFE